MKFLVSLFLVMSLTACGTFNYVAGVCWVASNLDAKDTEVLCK